MYKSKLKKHKPAKVANVVNKEEKPFACDYSECGFKTTSKFNLKLHKTKIHEDIRKREWKCPHCSYAAKCRNSLNAHLIIHTKQRNFPCSLCHHRTTRKSHLDVHMRTHTGEKPYKCSFCPYAAADKRNLMSHEFIHKNLKPFACTLCSYKSTQQSHLNEHLKRHLKEKSFNCPYCTYTAVCKSSLTSHIQTHFEPKNQRKKCPVFGCKYAAAQHTPWKVHLKNRHGLNPQEIQAKLKANPEIRFRNKPHFQPTLQQQKPIFQRYKCPVQEIRKCNYKTNKLDLLAAHLNVHKLPQVLLKRL